MESDSEGVSGIQVLTGTRQKAMPIGTHEGAFVGRSIGNAMRAKQEVCPLGREPHETYASQVVQSRADTIEYMIHDFHEKSTTA